MSGDHYDYETAYAECFHLLTKARDHIDTLEAQLREVQSTASILLEDKNTLVAQLKQNTHTAFASGWFAKMEPRGLTLAQALRAHMDTDTP